VAGPVSTVSAARACPPDGWAVSFSDSLDKLVYNGVKLGGLSSLAYDPRSAAYVSAVDNNGTDPARIGSSGNLSQPEGHPRPARAPQSRTAPRTTGRNSDNEGLAVLPDGDYLVSSEDRGRRSGSTDVTASQKASLPVPAPLRG